MRSRPWHQRAAHECGSGFRSGRYAGTPDRYREPRATQSVRRAARLTARLTVQLPDGLPRRQAKGIARNVRRAGNRGDIGTAGTRTGLIAAARSTWNDARSAVVVPWCRSARLGRCAVVTRMLDSRHIAVLDTLLHIGGRLRQLGAPGVGHHVMGNRGVGDRRGSRIRAGRLGNGARSGDRQQLMGASGVVQTLRNLVPSLPRIIRGLPPALGRVAKNADRVVDRGDYRCADRRHCVCRRVCRRACDVIHCRMCRRRQLVVIENHMMDRRDIGWHNRNGVGRRGGRGNQPGGRGRGDRTAGDHQPAQQQATDNARSRRCHSCRLMHGCTEPSSFTAGMSSTSCTGYLLQSIRPADPHPRTDCVECRIHHRVSMTLERIAKAAGPSLPPQRIFA